MEAQTENPASSSSPCVGCARRDRKIASLQAENDKLQTENDKLQTEIAALGAKLEAALREGKRQAAPFSKGDPKPDPKRPGRKSGKDHGRHAHRQPPAHIDEIIEVPLPTHCSDPNCPGKVHQTGVVPQYQTEIPRRAIHRQFNIEVGECSVCHRTVRGRHPLQTSDAGGAAASQLGSDAQALIVQLNKEAGLSQGKVQRFLKAAFDMDVSRAGVCRAMLRAGRRCEPAYQDVIQEIRQAPAVVPDETGWRVGGKQAWVHVVATPKATAYLVDPRRGYEATVKLLGADFEGSMTHDGWAAYYRFLLSVHQTCLGHLSRRSEELIKRAGDASDAIFPTQVQMLLREALAVRDQRDRGELTPAEAASLADPFWHRAVELARTPGLNTDNRRFAKHLWNNQESLFTFLRYPEVDATNYRAEHAIRMAAVNRKVWGGNRTAAGAQAQGVLMSVLKTTTQRGIDTLNFIAETLRSCFSRPRIIIPDSS